MTIRPVRLLGDPILRSKCEPISDPASAAVRLVASDLKETFNDLRSRYGYGRGLAAPQIGAPLRVIYAVLEQPTVLLNPEIVDVGTEDFLVWDDCFSAPDLMVRVQRAYHIKVAYQDLSGNEKAIEVEEAAAELLQHEIDHLDGVLHVDRATGLDPFCLAEEWNKHYKTEGRYTEPTPRTLPPAARLAV